MRRSPRRLQRLPAPRRGAPRRRRILDRRPRLDKRNRAERQAHRARQADRRRSHHARLDRRRVRARASVTAAIAHDEALLALKVAFLVLLYLFIWMIVR